MANAAGFNSSDKSSKITISNLNPYMGVNVDLTHDTNSGWGTARSTSSWSSGKWIFYLSSRQLAGGAQTGGGGIGIVNGSATLTNYIGSDANGFGWEGQQLVTNGGVTWNSGAPFVKNSGSYIAICLNADASPKRIHFCRVNNNAPASTDTGWVDWSGTASDPTNNSSGTDISSLGTPLYVMAGGDYSTFISEVFVNFGGWPPATDIIPIPSGYSMPDANYPFTIPVGTWSVSNKSNASGSTLSQSNMRLTTTSGSGVSSWAYSSAFPTNSTTIHAFFWDNVAADGTIRALTGLYVPGNSDANQARWNRDGTTTNLGGVTWTPWVSGDTTYIAYNAATKRLWGTKDGSTWYGNGGASPNPFTGTNGADVSGITNIGNACPGASINSDFRQTFTFNAGALTDTTITLSGGWTWLEDWASGRSFGYIIQ